MKTFEYPTKTKKLIIDNFNKSYVSKLENTKIDDVMALSTIQKAYGNKCKIHVFKTYHSNNIYGLWESDNEILVFKNEEEAYKFIFGY